MSSLYEISNPLENKLRSLIEMFGSEMKSSPQKKRLKEILNQIDEIQKQIRVPRTLEFLGFLNESRLLDFYKQRGYL